MPDVNVSGQSTPFFAQWKLCMVLALLAGAVYINTLFNGYALDDDMVIARNAYVQQGVKSIPLLLATPHLMGYNHRMVDTYRPLSLVMFALEYQLFGLNPLVGHLVNIFLFMACVVMLFIFLNELFGPSRTTLAFIATLIFAVHPIHTEVVANVKGRDDLLCFFLAFLSSFLFLGYAASGCRYKLVLGLLCALLAFLSKETVVTFVAINALIFFFYKHENRTRSVVITVGMVAIAFTYILLRTVVMHKYAAGGQYHLGFEDNLLVAAPSLSARLATAIMVLGNYLKLQIIPYPLICLYSYNTIPVVGFANPVVIVSAIIYLSSAIFGLYRLRTYGKDPWAFAILFYLITIALFSNTPFLVWAVQADRFTFFSSAGICMLLALAIETWWPRTKHPDILRSKVGIGLLLIVGLLYGTVTIARNADWKNNYSLFSADLTKAPNDIRLHHHLAATINLMALSEKNDSVRSALENESIVHFKKALELYPQYESAMTDLATLYSDRQMFDSAEKYFLKALSLRPKDAVAANNLGSLYYNLGRYEKAAFYYKKATLLTPDINFSYLNLSRACFMLNEHDSVIKYCRLLLRIEPKNIDGNRQMAESFAKLGQLDSAEYRYVLNTQILSNNAGTQNDLGIFYLNSGQYSKAIKQFKKSISIDWNNKDTYHYIGLAFFRSYQFNAAITVFNKEFELDPQNGQDYPLIAEAYKKMGREDMAQKYATLVRKTDPAYKIPD